MASWTSIALITLVGIPSFRPQEKPPAAVASSRAERLAAIQKEWDDARKAFSKAYGEATPAQREKLAYPDGKTLMPRVWDLVHEDSRDATALDALTWIVQMNPSRPELADALTAIEMDHLKSPKLGAICASLRPNVATSSSTRSRKTSRPRISTGRSSSSRDPAGRSSCSISGAIGEALAGLCTRTIGRSWRSTSTLPSPSSA